MRHRAMVWPCRCGQDERQEHAPEMKRVVVAIVVALLASARAVVAQPVPVVVAETTKGAFAFETYPNDAPKTVAPVPQLVGDGFYDGQHFQPATPGLVGQWCDP